MRKFMIFNINDEMTILSKSYPYRLYKSIEQISKLQKKDVSLGMMIYEQLIMPLDINSINKEIYLTFKDNDYYRKINNSHIFYNKYRPEDSKLTLYNSYICLESNVINPEFFKYLKNKKNLFVCDFENKDYFWTDQLLIKR